MVQQWRRSRDKAKVMVCAPVCMGQVIFIGEVKQDKRGKQNVGISKILFTSKRERDPQIPVRSKGMKAGALRGRVRLSRRMVSLWAQDSERPVEPHSSTYQLIGKRITNNSTIQQTLISELLLLFNHHILRQMARYNIRIYIFSLLIALVSHQSNYSPLVSCFSRRVTCKVYYTIVSIVLYIWTFLK